MIKGKIFTVPFRRKRQGRTYYKKRLKILLSNKNRFVVRKSLKNFQASIIEYNAKGDKILFTVDSNTLAKLGWKGGTGNIPSAYLIGFITGKKAIEKGIKDAIFDIGLNVSIKGSRLYAALAGAIDSGLKIPFNPEVLPQKERIVGEHIVKYAQSLKNNQSSYTKQFSEYIKKGLAPEDVVKHFNEIKGKINA
ncbi:MAG: 50S ribosomal protein L18 [Candidatus Woesearchaeota archaeon]|jgi:large subunit ribosomal protein L18|nr:50S ribosomal protein L18 [Candidatus Woesearchaeota archaeon]|tara:strand:- start:7064 stop:7642 length:579 start_codon:yes stop_codon:yes gene_type:complete